MAGACGNTEGKALVAGERAVRRNEGSKRSRGAAEDEALGQVRGAAQLQEMAEAPPLPGPAGGGPA